MIIAACYWDILVLVISMDYRCEDRKRIGEFRGDIGAIY
jgi:hypothetical protein